MVASKTEYQRIGKRLLLCHPARLQRRSSSTFNSLKSVHFRGDVSGNTGDVPDGTREKSNALGLMSMAATEELGVMLPNS